VGADCWPRRWPIVETTHTVHSAAVVVVLKLTGALDYLSFAALAYLDVDIRVRRSPV